jgi:hypothetical protein
MINDSVPGQVVVVTQEWTKCELRACLAATVLTTDCENQ